ncbi:MAG: hydrolase [Desulfobacter sp.]|nr:MAG: hydrolase [Desulfobacter sp.]
MFEIDKSVMLLVDVQGQLAELMYEKESLFNNLEILIKSIKLMGIPIIWMEQIPSKLGRTTPRISELMEGESPVEKSSFSCCGEPEFMSRFNTLGRSQVIITGIESHICVYQTGLDLVGRNCKVQVVADCVSSRTAENKAIGLNRLERGGAGITSVEMLIFELLKTAEGDLFKQIVKLIK